MAGSRQSLGPPVECSGTPVAGELRLPGKWCDTVKLRLGCFNESSSGTPLVTTAGEYPALYKIDWWLLVTQYW